MPALPDGSASIFAVATRVSTLDVNGFVPVGSPTFVTNTLVKATLSPVVESGDDIFIKNAAGDGAAWAKHPDMRKYYTVSIELATPDASLEQALAGGLVYTDITTALGTPAGSTATGQTTLGTLAAGTYGYRVTQYNAYGESAPQATFTGNVASGSTGTVVVTQPTFAATALAARVYGRTPGGEQLLGTIPNIGSQATSAVSGTGAVTSLTVTALTKSIPIGTTFQITGDTNTPKIVFTTTSFAPVGATTIQVSASQSVTITIAAAAIVPVFVDTGAVTPNGAFPTTDTTAGPGIVGYQEPALGIVGNPNGVSIEFWSKAVLNGFQQPILPYYRWVLPRVNGMHTMPRDITNANTQTVIEGQGYGNPNWGTGPQGDWQFDSTKVFQRARCGAQVVPAASNAPVSVAANI